MTGPSDPRTYLFVPANRPDRFGRALASGADAVVLDLEDAVAADAKETAREAVRVWAAEATPDDRARAVVRTNDLGSPHAAHDLAVVVEAGLAAVMLPNQPGSWAGLGGALATIGGWAFVGATMWEARRAK